MKTHLSLLFSALCLLAASPVFGQNRLPPGSDSKNCDYRPSGNQLVPVCMVGGRYARCNSDLDCKAKRCDASGQCSIYGNLGLCSNQASCLELSCVDPGQGNPRQCVRGDMGSPSCSSNNDCKQQKYCHWPAGATAPQCVAGVGGISCETAEEDCHTARCTRNEVTGVYECLQGSQGYGDDCKSSADCPLPDLRCSTSGLCSIEGKGTRCTSSGADPNCEKLFCSYPIGGGGNVCKRSGEANSSIPCSDGAAENSLCDLGNKKCGIDSKSGAPTCTTGGTGAPCSTPASCGEKRCDQGQCILGGSGKKCGATAECTVKRCSADGSKCERNDLGIGFPCQDLTQCLRHFSCSEGQCKERQGPGINTCDPNSDNNTCPQWHRACRGGVGGGLICTTVPGEGEDTCERDEDCDTLPQHKECIDDDRTNEMRCFTMLGEGVEQCEDDSDCSHRYRMDEKKLLSSKVNSEILARVQGAYTIGKYDAPIQVMYFQDLTCGMCKGFHQRVFSALKRDYIEKGLLRFTFVDFPLIPKDTELELVYGARCAAKQSKYLEYLDALYAASEKNAQHIGKKIDLDMKAFNSCVSSNEIHASLAADQSTAHELNISGTPTIYVNGEDFSGLRPYEQWTKKISMLLEK